MTTPTHVDPIEAHPGSLIDRRFRVRREIARGGMGVVFEAEHVLTRSKVAIKALTQDALGWPGVHNRLLREARALAIARHPGVAEIHDAGECPLHGPFLALEMIDGRSLESFLVARLTLDVDTVVAVAEELGAALTTVHARGVVHRDIKPGNVIVTRHPDRDVDRLKLVDFGIARVAEADDVVDARITRNKDVVGTVEFIAPELLVEDRAPSASSDVYALGVTLYECLTGEVPFPGTLSSVMRAHLEGRSVPSIRKRRADVPEALEAAILRAIDRDPARRFATAEALARACVDALGRSPRPIELLGGPRTRPEEGRRQFVRAPYVTPVRIVAASGPCDGRTEDLSEGGLLVVTSGLCAEGERVTVRLPLPATGRVVTLSATARWAKTQRGSRAIGLELDPIPEEIREEIRRYVALMCVQASSSAEARRSSVVRAPARLRASS